MYRNPLADDEEVLTPLSPEDSAEPQQLSSTQSVFVAPTTEALSISPPEDVQAQYDPAIARINEKGSQPDENFLEHLTTNEEEHDGKSATAKTLMAQATEAQVAVPNAGSEEAIDEDNDSNNDNGDDGAYAAEYRSLLFRVAEMEAQEQQRARQGSFALRMAKREAKLMAEVTAQQQVSLASQALSASCLNASEGTRTSKTSAESEESMRIPSPRAWLSAENSTADVATDARLACLAHRMEHAQLHCRRCTEAAGLLRSRKRSMCSEAEYHERLKAETEVLLCRLHEDAALAAGVSTSAVEQSQEGSDCAHPFTASPLAASHLHDMWQKQTSGLTALGGTLAKVHTLFRDPECRTNMSVVATALTEVGRRCQFLLQGLQALTEAELQTEADLSERRVHTLEWSIFAAHAQQACELRDLYSPVTLAEMRIIGLRKILLRRRQELQTALTLILLRDAEKTMNGTGRADGTSCSAPLPQLPCVFSSPPHEVTPEKMKAVADTCARREALRDRLLRELLYLKKCARRVLGAAWVSQTEVTALASLASMANTRGNSRILESVLEDNLRRASYNSMARLIAFVASIPKPPDEIDNAFSGNISDPPGDRDDEGKAQDGSDGNTSPQRSYSSVPAAPLATRVQVLSMVETLQTRAHSLLSLLAENAKHWQRTQDTVVEAEVCSIASEDAWCRTAELLMRRCTGADCVEPLPSNRQSTDDGLPNARTSPLLLQEQQLLDSLHASQATILEAINTALAQVHHRCAVPLERAKREIALLIRLLQLSDEAGESERHCGDVSSTDLLVASTTPALESAVQLLECAEGAELEGDGVCKGGLLSQVRVPQLPLRVDAVQGTISALSAKWKDSVAAETAETRATVTETQAKLDQYAQYSMAEVPSLLEKALAEAKALQERTAECTARNRSAASLSTQIQQQRKLLTDTTVTERDELAAAVQQARLQVEALRVQVAYLQKQKELSETESLHRSQVREAETVAWQSLLEDAGQYQTTNIKGIIDDAVEVKESASIKQEDSDSLPDVATDVKAMADQKDPAVGCGVANSELFSATRDDEGKVPEIMKEEEDEASEHEAGDAEEQEQNVGDEAVEEVTAESETEKHYGDVMGFAEKEANEEVEDEEAHPLQMRDHTSAEGEEFDDGHHADDDVPTEEQGNTQSGKGESTAQDRVEGEPHSTTGTSTSKMAEAVTQVEVKGKKSRKRPPKKSAQHEVQQWPHQHVSQQQQPSILGESILGCADPGQRPPVFDSPATNPFSQYVPPSPFSTEPASRPVYEDSPFYSGFGFEEE
ncbi:hypothetical protein, conserved [Leishmania tarentolae]|uniref:Uncharacterized protein n=1 Tax=Leishmania tarentolae TaxID=5689 RepID=A0A640KSH8_LEITA|nr:hypothetical protein, conserved [Leishmania tarentolae]